MSGVVEGEVVGKEKPPSEDSIRELIFHLREFNTTFKRVGREAGEREDALIDAIDGDDENPGLTTAVIALAQRVEALLQVFVQIKANEGGAALLARIFSTLGSPQKK